jgi:hypothetical protein
MPSTRGSGEEHDLPDTKIPRAIIPHHGDAKITKLSAGVTSLGLGEFQSEYHYAAMMYLENLGKFVLLYREAGQPWSVDNFKVLRKTFDDSMNMLDTNKDLQTFMNGIQALSTFGAKPLTRRRRQRTRQTRRRQK